MTLLHDRTRSASTRMKRAATTSAGGDPVRTTFGRRLAGLAMGVLLAVPCALFGCGGGGTDERAVKGSDEHDVVAVPGSVLHCPERKLPVPAGADFSGRNIGPDTIAPGQDLRGANFDGATITAYFSGDLTGATFRHARLSGAFFAEGSDLSGANFEEVFVDPSAPRRTVFLAKLDGACFIRARFSLYHGDDEDGSPANFVEVALVDVDFSESDALAFVPGNLLGELGSPIGQALTNAGSQGNRLRGVKIPCEFFLSTYLNAMDLEGADLSGCRQGLGGRDLSNASLEHLDLRGFSFAGANLAGTRFDGATFGPLPGSDNAIQNPLDGALNAGKATFKGALFVSAQFGQVDLQGADFTGAMFSDVVFAGTELQGAHFEGASGFSPRFTGARIDGAHFDQAVLRLSEWNGSTLDGASFQKSTLVGAVFTGAQARGTFFNGAILIGADFSKTAGLQGANFTNAELSNSTFAGALLDNLPTASPPIVASALFTGAHLKNVNFKGARLDGADFGSASLYGATQPSSCTTDVTQCTETRTGLTCGCASANGASMINTNFTKAFLYGADFRGATFGKTRFDQAILVTASFGGANFVIDTARGGGVSSFERAQLQGVDLGGADLTGASLAGAQVDFGVGAAKYDGNELTFQLDASYTGFAGWSAPSQPVCVRATYLNVSRLPTGATGMTCPDGSSAANGCGANIRTNPLWKSSTPIDVGPPKAAYTSPPSFGGTGDAGKFGCAQVSKSW